MATSEIWVLGGGGLADSIRFAVEGLPTGMKATFDPDPAPAGTTNLRITAGLATAAGSYLVRVRAAAGPITKTITLVVTVLP